MTEFQVLAIDYGAVNIGVRLQWLPLPSGGAIRTSDRVLWRGARQCRSCRVLGIDPSDIDSLIEAQRLGLDHAPRVVPCASCGEPRCETCTCCKGAP